MPAHLLLSVLKLYTELSKKGFHILFCWVPGHEGIRGNEAADKAAKKACYHLNCPVTYSDIKHAIKLFSINKWQRKWNGHHGNKLYDIKSCISF